MFQAYHRKEHELVGRKPEADDSNSRYPSSYEPSKILTIVAQPPSLQSIYSKL